MSEARWAPLGAALRREDGGWTLRVPARAEEVIVERGTFVTARVELAIEEREDWEPVVAHAIHEELVLGGEEAVRHGTPD